MYGCLYISPTACASVLLVTGDSVKLFPGKFWGKRANLVGKGRVRHDLEPNTVTISALPLSD